MSTTDKIKIGIVDDKYFIAKSIEERLSYYEEVSIEIVSESDSDGVKTI